MQLPIMCVIYSQTHKGDSALRYAADFVRHGWASRLIVYLAKDANAGALAATSGVSAPDDVQKQRVKTAVSERTGLISSQFTVQGFPAELGVPQEFPRCSILVDEDQATQTRTVTVISPFDETSVERVAESVVLIPFGNGASEMVAAAVGLSLAKAASKSVVFYHTTWRDTKQSSTDARDHMSLGARNNMDTLEATAREEGISYETVIEMADDVVEGLVNCAIRSRAMLIVMARDPKIGIGSYVTLALKQSPVPVMIANDQRECSALSVPLVQCAKHVKSVRKEDAPAEEAKGSKLSQTLGWLWHKLAELSRNPSVVMGIVALMYVFKASFKIHVGSSIHSPMITGDGFHNLSDLVEAFAVIAVILVARRPCSEDYPFGKKNIEFFTSLSIGGALLFMSWQFAKKSIVGILASWPSMDATVRAIISLPAHERLVMDGATFPWVVALTGGSIILSLLVSRYQISVGKLTGHASLVADGEETASDGRIETVTLAGVLGEYWLHAPWLEYPLGLLVAFLIARTGLELFVGACRVLMQHSIGREHDQAIRDRSLLITGVIDMDELKTFQVGHTAVCMMRLQTHRNNHTVSHIRHAVSQAVRDYLLGQDFKECELDVRFHKPDPQRHRIAFALVKGSCREAVAPSLAQATHLVICDVEHGAVVRTAEEVLPSDPAGLLSSKRVRELYTFCPDAEDAGRLASTSIKLLAANSYLSSVVGLTA